MNKKFDLSEVGNDCLAESNRILNCYIRYVYRKYKLYNFPYYSFIYSPRYTEYSHHITSILLLSRRYSFEGIRSFKFSPTNCKEIDLLVIRFVKKRYNLNLKYDQNFKLNKNTYYKPFRINLIKILRDICFDLREIKISKSKLKSEKAFSNSRESVLILSHKISDDSKLGPYHLFPEDLKKYLSNKNINFINILPNQIGLKYSIKLKNLIKISIFIFCKLIKYRNISLTNIHFIFYIFYRRLYKNQLKKFLLLKKISHIFCSYIDIGYEPSYFNAAKELNLQYFLYDYSVGYPLKELKFLRYLPDTRKYSKIVFFNSEFRKEQYEKSNFIKESSPILLPLSCPQIDFSKNRNILSVNNNKKSFRIAIVDNIFADDLILNYLDIHSLVKHLVCSNFNLKFILQSKRGKLLDFFKELDFDFEDYQNSQKGDFSLLRKADLILSIGWQGTSLKASHAFNKPLLFYSHNGYPYKEHFYSFDHEKNCKINNYCESLWTSNSSFPMKLKKIIIDNNYFDYVCSQTVKMIENIGFKNDSIENYLNLYLK
jgi:hypothetical protein